MSNIELKILFLKEKKTEMSKQTILKLMIKQLVSKIHLLEMEKNLTLKVMPLLREKKMLLLLG